MDPYNQKTTYTIEKGCPWYEAQQSFGPPNINWCEPSRCFIFDEPANTISNLSFLIAFIYLIKKFKDQFTRFYATTLLVVGILSALFHASNNAFTQFFDYVGMFLMTSIILAFNSRRLFLSGNVYSYFWFYSFINLLIFVCFEYLEIPIQWTIVVNVFLILSTDLYNGMKEKTFKYYKNFFIGSFILVLAQSSAMIDLNRIYCNPDNLVLHGHVFWHLFNGLALTFMGIHMNSINSLKKS